VWDGVYHEDHAKRWRTIYQKECALVTVAMLTGGESALADRRPISREWNGITMGDLSTEFARPMPQTNPARHYSAQDADIIAFI